MNSLFQMRWNWMAGMCMEHGLRRGAELGTKEGRLPGYLFSVEAVDWMCVVDLFEKVPDNAGQEYAGWNWVEIREEYDMRRRPFADRWHTLEMSTYAAADEVEDGSLDFVYIDADHSEAGVSSDLRRWVPKVRPGGLVAGHDLDWPGVRKALDSVLGGKYRPAPNVSWYTWRV